MAKFSPQGDPLAGIRAQFAGRPPSAAWEQITLGPGVGFVWVWFKPPAVPQGLCLRIPDETYRTKSNNSGSSGNGLTLRALLNAAGVDLQIVSLCYVYGSPCGGRTATAPIFDQPLTEPPVGADPNIVVLLDVPVAELPPAVGLPVAAFSPDVVKVFDEMEADWYACQQIEKQLLLVRKELTGALARLAALDRDLSPEERLHGDRQDKSEWQDVRRSLKDATTKLMRYVKEHDVGETSAAGKRLWFTESYQQVVLPRRPFDGLLHLHHEFEAYRKRLQILLQNMSLANTTAAQEAERRAQQVLARLGSRARSAQHKTTGWTAHRWLNHKQRDRI
jgi:hypothetical protein